MLITAGGSCWKVMFSQASVISSVHGGVCSIHMGYARGGVCIQKRGSVSREVCIQDVVNERAVRILLECILVFNIIYDLFRGLAWHKCISLYPS